MSNIKDLLKWSILICLVALLFYFVFPKYKFMGPNDFAVFRCNIFTGEVLAWDIYEEKWVTPNIETISMIKTVKRD